MFIFNREINLEERQIVTNKAIAVYRDLETFLQSNEYNKDLRKELQKSNPDYSNVLSKRIRDLQTSDHGLVVSGKTDSSSDIVIYNIILYSNKCFFKKKLKPEQLKLFCSLQ